MVLVDLRILTMLEVHNHNEGQYVLEYLDKVSNHLVFRRISNNLLRKLPYLVCDTYTLEVSKAKSSHPINISHYMKLRNKTFWSYPNRPNHFHHRLCHGSLFPCMG